MNINEFIDYLKSLKIELTVKENKLKCNAPAGVLTPSLRAELAERKAEILEFLQQKIDRDEYSSIPVVDREGENLCLSFAQQRLWFLQQLESESSAYHTVRVLRLQGCLNREALHQALVTILKRHEALRTSFVSVDGNVRQVINAPNSFELSFLDLSEFKHDPSQDNWKSLLEKEFQRPFDLTADLMLRSTLVKLAPQEHLLQIVVHHIVSDRWSMGVLIEELGILYRAFSAGQPNPLSELPIQYADFATWQRQWLSGAVLESQLDYWKQHLAGASPLLELPTDRTRPSQLSYRGAKVTFALSQSLNKALKHLSQQAGTSLFMTLLAAFNTLLYRYTKQEDLVVGSPIANRNRPELEGLIGFFTNTLALRTDLSGNPSFLDLLKRVRQVALSAYEHQDLPFEKLVEELQPERNLSYSPLFQVMFVLLNTPQTDYKLGDLNVRLEKIEQEAAMFDLTLYMFEDANGLNGIFEYSTDLFEASTIERAIGHFQTLLEAIVANPNESIATLPLLTKAERHQLLVKWNDTQRDYPQDKCIHQLFEEQVERSPDSIAVVFQDRQITYRELNERANQLAHYLQSLGVKPETLVGICIERSLEMVVSLLGVLKAGGSYVPLDPTYPYERIEYTIKNSQLSVLIVQQSLYEQFSESNLQVVCIDVETKIAQQATHNCDREVIAENLAYTIYTSGSTGKPKGVQICHRAVINFLNSMRHEPGLTADDCLLAITTIAFDIAVLELYLPLSVGACIVLASSESAADPKKLSSLLDRFDVTVMQATPATWNMLMTANWQGKQNLKVLCGGEAMTQNLAEQLLAKSAAVWNMYGPTETTVWSSVSQVDCSANPVCIGLPIANTQFYVLDKQQQPLSIGIPGELYIGGAGLARGYLNKSQLTEEKFVLNCFNRDTSDRLYRTGDLAKYLPNGKIELIGRIDNQVKIRGFRVELGEIEAVLARHPDIRQAVAIVNDKNFDDKRLIAYIVARQKQPQVGELRSFLQEHLPNYMVPSVFVFLDTMPLTPNGKVDRKILPIPSIVKETENSFAPPTEEIEFKLTQIWSEVLNIPQVGIKDNFFELGGHSLLAVSLFSQIEKYLNISLPVSILFTAPTIEQLANIIRNSDWTAPWHSLVPIQTQGDRPPLFCIHGGGFNVLIYRELALNLGANQPVYGLQAKGLDGKSAPHSTIEDMAADYVKYIREIQPEGPYFIGGLSTGGRIALEMAQQLHKQKQKVALLAMFDTRGPSGLKLLPPLPRLLSTLSYALCYSAPRFVTKYIKEPSKIVSYLLDWLSKYHQVSQKQNPQVSPVQLLSVNNNDGKKQKNYFNEILLKFHEFILDHSPVGFYGQNIYVLPEELQKNNQSYRQARKRYVPQVYSGYITVFQATEQPPGFAIDSRHGWGEIAKGGLEIYKIPGHHTSIMQSPKLAKKLAECIEKAL